MTRHLSQCIDGDSGDKILDSLFFFKLQVALINSVFASLNVATNYIYCLIVIELDPKSMISH